MLYRFENFVLDSDRGELRRDEAPIGMEPQVFKLLLFLVVNRDRLVSKDALLDSVWGGRIVSDSSIATRINAARQAIGDNGKDQRLIRTTIGRGVRFVGAVTEQASRDPPAPSQPPDAITPPVVAPAVAMPARFDQASRYMLITGLAVLGLLGWWQVSRFVSPPGTPSKSATGELSRLGAAIPRLSIVVLPFANLSNDPDQEYFADGITDDLTSDLSRIRDSFVIARTTAFTYKGKPADVKQIGRELGIRYVLEGGVRRAGEEVQVNVRLIDAETGAHIWADRFDSNRGNLAKTQDEITGRLAQTLQVELISAAGHQIEREGPVNVDARDLVMRGWSAFYRPVSEDSTRDARRFFEQALEIDPASAGAKLGLADVLIQNVFKAWSKSPGPDMERAEKLLSEILERNGNDARTHSEMGELRRLQHRIPEAVIESEKALSLDPNFTPAMHQLGYSLIGLGEPERAISYFEKSLRLAPRSQNMVYQYSGMGFSHLFLGHADEAIDYFRKARAANSKIYYVHLALAAALGLRGDIDDAKEPLSEFQKLKPNIHSVAELRAGRLFGTDNPKYIALVEKTVYAGLRRAGFPDE